MLQGRKLRSKGTRILARGHTGMTNRKCPDPHSWLRAAPTEGGVALRGSLHEPHRQCCLPGSSRSWHRAQGLTQRGSSYLESLPKPPTKLDTSRAYFCWITRGWGRERRRRGHGFLSVNSADNVVTWHHTKDVIITYYKYKTLCSAELVKMGQELLEKAVRASLFKSAATVLLSEMTIDF